jgi:uncharacterized membrane protein YfcA
LAATLQSGGIAAGDCRNRGAAIVPAAAVVQRRAMDGATAAIAATFTLAGFVKGVIGLGLPTVAVGLLSVVMPPAHAAALLIVPSTVTNLWQLASGPSFAALLRRLWPMLLGVCAGTWAGSGLLSDGSGRAAAALGAALVAYAALGLVNIRVVVPQRAQPWLGPLVGVATGVVTAATGVFVIPAVPYLQALGLDRDDLVQALGLSFTVSTLALAASLASTGAFGLSVAGASLIALVPACLGMLAGQWLRARVKPEPFRLCFFAGLLVLGLHLALRGVI